MDNNNEYKLTERERAALQSLGNQTVNAKLAVYSLNLQLEAARAELKDSEARWLGALGLLATANGMEKVHLASDLSKITRSE